jgi:AbrB family looped-hinge helix DNA binding protein
MNTIRVQQRGTLTLPKNIREAFNLSAGEVLLVSKEDKRIVLERAESPDAELLLDIKQSLSDIKQGKYIEFKSISEFKEKLAKYDAD